MKVGIGSRYALHLTALANHWIGDIGGQHLTDMQKPWWRIPKSADLPDIRIHDLQARLNAGPSAYRHFLALPN